jgi:hypothetical protein
LKNGSIVAQKHPDFAEKIDDQIKSYKRYADNDKKSQKLF